MLSPSATSERRDHSLTGAPASAKPRGLRLIGALAHYYAIYRRFRSATLIGRDAYIANLYLAAKHLAEPALAGGCIVECGTWRGGMSAGLVMIGGRHRDYYFFDSFEGLPPASDKDGDYARSWQANRDGTIYADNCTASSEEFTATLSRVDLAPERLHVHKGFFEDTFLDLKVPPVALLRLDADWYESTLLCLETFWDRLIPGALIVIDDYNHWEGCRKAVHAFLAKRDAREAIRETRFGKVTYLVKT